MPTGYAAKKNASYNNGYTAGYTDGYIEGVQAGMLNPVFQDWDVTVDVQADTFTLVSPLGMCYVFDLNTGEYVDAHWADGVPQEIRDGAVG